MVVYVLGNLCFYVGLKGIERNFFVYRVDYFDEKEGLVYIEDLIDD